MIRKMAALLAGAALMLGASSAMATVLDPTVIRPVKINPSYPGENSLQTELDKIFGTKVINAATDQLGMGMYKVSTPSSIGIMPQFKFEWTSAAPYQGVGIFGWNGSKAVEAPIFRGIHTAGDYANVIWNTSDSGYIASYDVTSKTPWLPSDVAEFTGISRNFFGFYFQPKSGSDPTYFSVDSLNPNGLLHQAPVTARVLAYDANNKLPNSGIAFAYEDGSDFDYNDAGFFVESIAPVPEPGTMVLLGAGFLGLAIYGKRRRNA